jgi:hypothetical protein
MARNASPTEATSAPLQASSSRQAIVRSSLDHHIGHAIAVHLRTDFAVGIGYADGKKLQVAVA